MNRTVCEIPLLKDVYLPETGVEVEAMFPHQEFAVGPIIVDVGGVSRVFPDVEKAVHRMAGVKIVHGGNIVVKMAQMQPQACVKPEKLLFILQNHKSIIFRLVCTFPSGTFSCIINIKAEPTENKNMEKKMTDFPSVPHLSLKRWNFLYYKIQSSNNNRIKFNQSEFCTSVPATGMETGSSDFHRR